MEPNPVPGRHDIIFPMFEFEFKGDINELVELQKELLVHLGYNKDNFYENDYKAIAEEFGTTELEHEHEESMYAKEDGTPTFFLTDFPEYTSPFWNMKRRGDIANKVDVILHGVETIGSAERSCDPDEMHDQFLILLQLQMHPILFL